MPSGVTDYGATQWAQVITGAISLPSSYWIALCDEEPGTDMDGTVLADLEPVGGYGRVQYLTGPTYWDNNGQYVTNLNTISFGIPTADWGMITHFALCDASSGGDLYAFGEFMNPQDVTTQTSFTIPQGGIILALYSLQPSIAV